MEAVAGAGKRRTAAAPRILEVLLVDAAKAGVVLLAAIVLGAGAAFGDTVHYDPSSFRWVAGTLANLPFFWAALAFAAGAITSAWPKAALAGAVALAAAVAAYYSTHSLFRLREGVDDSTLVQAGEIWLIAAIPSGFFMGIAGRAWRAGHRLARIVAVGVLASTSLALLSFTAADSIVVAMATLTALSVAILLPRPRDFVPAFVLGLALAGVTGIVLQLLVEAARQVR